MTQMFTKAQTPADVPPPPTPTPPPPMPDPYGVASKEASRQAALTAAGRSGRSASILTTAQGRSTIAGGGSSSSAAPYSSPVLGGK